MVQIVKTEQLEFSTMLCGYRKVEVIDIQQELLIVYRTSENVFRRVELLVVIDGADMDFDNSSNSKNLLAECRMNRLSQLS